MLRFRHDGIDFAYLDQGAGPTVVLQHGLGGDVGQPLSLFDSAARLICLECRGHGGTQPLGPENRLSFATFAADLAALLEHLDVTPVVAGGVSMGAGVALRFAHNHRARVRALVLIRPAWFDRPHPPSLAAFTSVARLLREHEPERAREVFAASADYARVRNASAAAADSLLGQFSRPGAKARAAVLERLPADAPLPLPPSWHELDMPALVLGTSDDPLHPLTYADALATALPNAHLQTVTPKAVDEPAHRREVAIAIDVFLAGLPAPGVLDTGAC